MVSRAGLEPARAARSSVEDRRPQSKSRWRYINCMVRHFDVVIERDEEGMYLASVPQLRGCHTDAAALDELMVEIKEAIALCLDVEGGQRSSLEFIGIQRVTIAA